MSAISVTADIQAAKCKVVGTCGYCCAAMLQKPPVPGNDFPRPTCSNCGRVEKPTVGSKGQYGTVMDVTVLP